MRGRHKAALGGALIDVNAYDRGSGNAIAAGKVEIGTMSL
jgi:hypothetical protein